MSTDSGDGMEWIEEGLWEGFGRSCKYLELCFYTVLLWKVTIRFSETSPIVTVFSRQKERKKKNTIMEWGLCPNVSRNSWVGWKCQQTLFSWRTMPHLHYKRAGISFPQVQGWHSLNSFGCLLGRSQLDQTLQHYHEMSLGNDIFLCSPLNILNLGSSRWQQSFSLL